MLGWLLNLDFAASPAVAVVAPDPHAILDRPMRRVASVLHRRFGDTATVTFVASGTFDASTGTVSRSTTTSVESVAVHKNTRHGRELERGTVRLTIAAKDVDEVEITDTVTVGTDVYEVIETRHLWSGTKRAAYDLTVRK